MPQEMHLSVITYMGMYLLQRVRMYCNTYAAKSTEKSAGPHFFRRKEKRAGQMGLILGRTGKNTQRRAPAAGSDGI